MPEFVRCLQEELVAAIHLDATADVRSDQSPDVHPHHCASPMCVSERFLETLRLLEHPSEGPLVCEAGPRGDAVSVSMCLERVCRKFETIHQPSAAEQLASGLALDKEHSPWMPRSRRADFQLLPQSRQGSINDVFPRTIVGAGGTGCPYMCRLLCVCFSPPSCGAAAHHRG